MNWKSIIIQSCNDLSREDPKNEIKYDFLKFVSTGLINYFNKDYYYNDDQSVNKEKNNNKDESVNDQKEKKNECSICLESLNIEISLPCGHTNFHKKCVSTINKCPICRKKFDKVINLYM